jgi:hypothetical protein
VVRQRLELHAQPMDARDSLVVWSLGGCQQLCTIHLTDVVKGTDRVVYVPGPSGISNGALSPDGRSLAVLARRDTSSGVPNTLALVDTKTGALTSQIDLGEASGSGLRPAMTWASSGRWLFVTGLAGDYPIRAHRVGSGHVESVRYGATVTEFAAS